MDTLTAFAMGRANRGREMMVFDWHKAAELIRETGARFAAAGLSGDWEYTGGEILRNGMPVSQEDTHVYLASTWAMPEIEINSGPRISCYKMQSETPGWGSGTYWPETAREILGATAAA